jgi:hypothetical protein
LNNHYINLEWVTRSENGNHAHSLGLNKTIRRVYQYTREGKYLHSFNNCREAAESLEIMSKKKTIMNHISRVCRSKRETAYGYKWKYGETLYDYLSTNKI